MTTSESHGAISGSRVSEAMVEAALDAHVVGTCPVIEYLDFNASDAKEMGVSIEGENFAGLDIIRHEQWRDAGRAIMRAALTAALSIRQGGVKALEWVRRGAYNDAWDASPLTGDTYSIKARDNGEYVIFAEQSFLDGHNFPSLKAAMAACQADFNTRILSTLTVDVAQCCMCGKTGLSTVEGDGGTECQLEDGRWTCSLACWDKAGGDGPDLPSPAQEIADKPSAVSVGDGVVEALYAAIDDHLGGFISVKSSRALITNRLHSVIRQGLKAAQEGK